MWFDVFLSDPLLMVIALWIVPLESLPASVTADRC